MTSDARFHALSIISIEISMPHEYKGDVGKHPKGNFSEQGVHASLLTLDSKDFYHNRIPLMQGSLHA